MSYTIRFATTADASAIAQLYNELGIRTNAAYRTVEVSVENRRQWLVEQERNGYPVLVAEESGQLLGYAGYLQFRSMDGYDHTVENTIWVAKAAQGKGVGKALMLRLFEIATQNRVHVMIASIDSENLASQIFHEKLGFQKLAALPEVGYKNGQWLTTIFYHRFIGR